jgi:hypothetical protein
MTKNQRRILIVVGAVALPILVLVFVKPAAPRVAFRMLRCTNDASGLRALVQMTNSSNGLLYDLHTQVLSDSAWRRSASQPPFGSFPPQGAFPYVLPARQSDYNVWVPVPREGPTWRIELEVWPDHVNPIEQKLFRFCSYLGVKYPFYSGKILSQDFTR